MASASPHVPTPAEINAKYGYDVFADQSDRILAASVTLIILPTIFVILRFTSRAVSKAGFWVWILLQISKKLLVLRADW